MSVSDVTIGMGVFELSAIEGDMDVGPRSDRGTRSSETHTGERNEPHGKWTKWRPSHPDLTSDPSGSDLDHQSACNL